LDSAANYESHCWLRIDGLWEPAGPVLGISTLHALCKALNIAENAIEDFVREGGSVTDDDGRELQLRSRERIVSAPPRELLAQHLVVSVAPEGLRRPSRFALGNTAKVDDGWQCAIVDDGLESLSIAVEAPTHLGCVLGAVAELSARVRQRVEHGWRFFEPDEEENEDSAIHPRELFDPLRNAPP
jgi:hypothetical protein